MQEEKEQFEEEKGMSISPFWSERNFLVLPFFVLDGKSEANIIEYHSTIRESGTAGEPDVCLSIIKWLSCKVCETGLSISWD